MKSAIVRIVQCRHYRLEAELLAEVNWRVRWNDIRFNADSTSDAARRSTAPGAHLLERNGSRYSRVEYCARALFTSPFLPVGGVA